MTIYLYIRYTPFVDGILLHYEPKLHQRQIEDFYTSVLARLKPFAWNLLISRQVMPHVLWPFTPSATMRQWAFPIVCACTTSWHLGRLVMGPPWLGRKQAHWRVILGLLGSYVFGQLIYHIKTYIFQIKSEFKQNCGNQKQSKTPKPATAP